MRRIITAHPFFCVLFGASAYPHGILHIYHIHTMMENRESIMTLDDKYVYWLELAEYDLESANAMFKTGRWFYVVIMCQQAIEKVCKGLYTLFLGDTVPRFTISNRFFCVLKINYLFLLMKINTFCLIRFQLIILRPDILILHSR